MSKQKISAKQTKPRCYNYIIELNGTFITEKYNHRNFKNSVDGVNNIVEMTEERINELEESDQNSPKVNNREKTGPHPKKKS